MQFYSIAKKMKTFHEISMILGVKIPSALTDVGMGQFTTTLRLTTTWNKQTSTILVQKPVAVLSFEGQDTKALRKFACTCKLLRFFYAEDFVGRIDIMLLNFISRYFL